MIQTASAMAQRPQTHAISRAASQMVTKAAHCPQDLNQALGFLDGSVL